ncbi:ABC transporter substrate-binding protein [Paenibacillus sp. GCM10027628]|uniref:ABC transporter substrate-binding protein n=1 Tax=Paenibacillus sp. GCM10027628 TaxID=3273413 RepID=UPI00363A6132
MSGIGSKKSWGSFLSLVLLTGVIAGCGSSGKDDQTPAATNAAGGNKTEKKVTLHMIESLTSPKRTDLLKGMITQFESQNPNIKVELISPPFDQADNKIKTMLAAKQDLDVLEVRDLNVAEMVNNGYVEPLDAFTGKWSDMATFGAVPKSVGSINNKLYFIANGLYERQMFYRKDWFAEKGLKVPTNWQELFDTAKALTDPAKNRYGFSFRGGMGSAGITDAMVLSYNADQVNLEDSQFLKSGKTIYSTPEAKQAMDLYFKLYKEASPPDAVNWAFQEQVQAFTSGVTGILLQDPDVIQSLQEKMKPDTWSTAPMPTGPSGKALISAGGAGWGITSYSQNKEEAWKLIAFLSSPQQNTAFSKNYGLVPVHSSAANDDFFKTGPYKTLLDMTNKPDTFVNYKPPFQYPGTGQWNKVSMESQQMYLLGKSNGDEMLKKWDAYWADQKAQMKK